MQAVVSVPVPDAVSEVVSVRVAVSVAVTVRVVVSAAVTVQVAVQEPQLCILLRQRKDTDGIQTRWPG